MTVRGGHISWAEGLCLSARGKSGTWGRVSSSRAVWLELYILQFPSLVCLPSPSRNSEEERGRGAIQQLSPVVSQTS